MFSSLSLILLSFGRQCQESCQATQWEAKQPIKEEQCIKNKQAKQGIGQSADLGIPLTGHLQKIHTEQWQTEKSQHIEQAIWQ